MKPKLLLLYLKLIVEHPKSKSLNHFHHLSYSLGLCVGLVFRCFRYIGQRKIRFQIQCLDIFFKHRNAKLTALPLKTHKTVDLDMLRKSGHRHSIYIFTASITTDVGV